MCKYIVVSRKLFILYISVAIRSGLIWSSFTVYMQLLMCNYKDQSCIIDFYFKLIIPNTNCNMVFLKVQVS